MFGKQEISFKEFIKKDKFVEINTILALVFNIINWGLVYYYFSSFLAGQNESIILHYNIYYGIDMVGPWVHVYFLPLTGFAILLVNLLIAYFLYSKDKLISYLSMSVALFSQLLLNIATFFIIAVNHY